MADVGRLRRIGLILGGCVVMIAGCGGDDDAADSGTPPARADGTAELKRAVDLMHRKGTAEFTLSFNSDNLPAGEDGVEADGVGRVDFRRTRAQYVVRYHEAPGVDAGTELEFHSDGATTYARPRGSGLYQLQEPSLVANGPADSFKYIATDTIGVHETGAKTVEGRRCTTYEGKLDFTRIRARAPASRRAEFDRTTRGVKTQDFNVCIDNGHVVREYGFDVRVPGGGDFVLRVVSRFTRVGNAEPVEALRADEKE